jgi:putative nucleotidyltransferase with HDIG domain
MEISRPDHPLLQMILRNAPGTYQHSLQVANLAEQAAERIGADPLLTRVGALYHDVGKALDPAFFIENQMPGSVNPHDRLDPHSSAHMILRHVLNGLELARKHKLPSRIQDFIVEHHGTMITYYQLVKAIDAVGGDKELVEIERFRYPGPRPRSRETAILMLADGCEARVRAEHPKDESELRSLIKSVIDNRIATGQLDETNLTLRNLNAIVDSFTTTLKGVYHPRIQYPKLDQILQPGAAEDHLSPKTLPAARPPDSDLPLQPPAETSAANPGSLP